MKKILFAWLIALTLPVAAAETVRVYSPYNAGHSGTPAMLRILEQANASQTNYQFVLEFRPGGNQTIAVRAMDGENSLAVIAPSWVENVAQGQLVERDYVPIWALGDACWAVVVNKPLVGAREFVVGGVAVGNASHLTALALGQRYRFDVRYIMFKSNNDALVNMAGNNGVEMVIDRYESYQAMRAKNPNLNMIAASCPTRLPQEPTIKTLNELGIQAPFIFNIVIAHKDMPVAKRTAIANILNSATVAVGSKEIYQLSAMRPPVFDNISVEQFYQRSTELVKKLQNTHKTKLEAAVEYK